MRTLSLVALLAAAVPAPAQAPAAPPRPVPRWERVVLDAKFRSEGVAVADVNKDGKLDVLTGEHWYAAPDWTPHELQPAMDHGDGLGGNGRTGYSRVFACWADDFNADTYPDLLIIGFPGEPCHWLENPGKTVGEHKGPWRKHQVWHSACNETPLYVDLLGTGKRVLVMATQPKGAKPTDNMGQMAYFTPAADCYAEWALHPVSVPSGKDKVVPGTFRYAHGLGAGDMNGDGKPDVLCEAGWWEQPAGSDKPAAWAFHPAALGSSCADMFAHDVDGDGLADVLSSSAHRFGVQYYSRKQPPDAKTGKEPAPDANAPFLKVDLFPRLVSETHAMHFVDVDGDGQKDLVTGKRWWSHGRSEPGSAWPAKLYWFQATKEKDGITSFTPHLIDTDSGVGTQFVVTDVDGDGKPDIVSSNKRGVRVILQRAGTWERPSAP